MSAVESQEWHDSSILLLGRLKPRQSSATGSAAVTSSAAALIPPLSSALSLQTDGPIQRAAVRIDAAVCARTGEADRQTDRQAGRHRQTDRQIDKQTERARVGAWRGSCAHSSSASSSTHFPLPTLMNTAFSFIALKCSAFIILSVAGVHGVAIQT